MSGLHGIPASYRDLCTRTSDGREVKAQPEAVGSGLLGGRRQEGLWALRLPPPGCCRPGCDLVLRLVPCLHPVSSRDEGVRGRGGAARSPQDTVRWSAGRGGACGQPGAPAVLCVPLPPSPPPLCRRLCAAGHALASGLLLVPLSLRLGAVAEAMRRLRAYGRSALSFPVQQTTRLGGVALGQGQVPGPSRRPAWRRPSQTGPGTGPGQCASRAPSSVLSLPARGARAAGVSDVASRAAVAVAGTGFQAVTLTP